MSGLHRVLPAFELVLDRALLLRAVARCLIANVAPALLFADADREAVERFGRGAGTEQEQRRGENETKLPAVNTPRLLRHRIAWAGVAFNPIF